MARTTQKGANTVDVDDRDDYDEGRNIILSLISQLRPGSDLSRITLPTFILERKSMLERITNTFQHPKMMAQAEANPDPVQRFVDVLRWYMSGWHIAPKAVKKPLNPVLGEYFTCFWELDNDTKAYYLAEQTSHHAPKSSFYFVYPEHNIRAEGIVIPISKFLGNSAASMMEGVARVILGNHVGPSGEPEEYEITQPNVYARNVIVGTLKLEMGDKAYVKCPQLDMECIIDFKVKGYISGTYHEIKGTVTRAGKPLYEISGKWTEALYIKDLKTGKKSLFFDALDDVASTPQTRSLEEQGQMESRRLWHDVCVALGERNQKVATDEKFEIEDYQRRLQKRRNDGLEPPFQPKLFRPVDDQYQFRIFADAELRAAKTQADVERVLARVAPILPGQQFPQNFEQPAADKVGSAGSALENGSAGSAQDSLSAQNTLSTQDTLGASHSASSTQSKFYRYEGDEFLDAPEPGH